jgi:hypothetical protein
VIIVRCSDSDHAEEIRPEVAAILEAEGVIVQNEQGEGLTGYVCETEQALKEALNNVDLMVCDFCSSPDVAWVYPAEDYMMVRTEGITHMSRSDWAACEVCHHLIEMQLLDDLNQRAFRNFPETAGTEGYSSPMAAALVMEAIKGNTARFNKHRTGPPVRIGGEKENATEGEGNS